MPRVNARDRIAKVLERKDVDPWVCLFMHLPRQQHTAHLKRCACPSIKGTSATWARYKYLTTRFAKLKIHSFR